jgi:hypothetical protein
MGEKQPDVYSSIIHVTDGVYHAIKIIRRLSMVELYIDGSRVELDGEHSMFMVNINIIKRFICLEYSRQSEQRSFLAQRRLRIGSFKNVSQWTGILAGMFN